ncbi:aminoglycoside phosphotransferase APH(3') [Streptococcus entericus]|uniref:aminoglycoside phosphotransferase APH(3') n=1 Tax=Streptococcus entericus TaxID=155680 RepID=UPI00037071FA|nr:aminoglycoside phosphotransferase APH(3') [Streptococcus entericus]
MTNLNPHDFPKVLAPYLAGASIKDCSSHSTATVWALSTGYFLKVDAPTALAREAQWADWFFQQGLGVEVVLYITDDRDYLLTRAGDGQPAYAYLDRPEQLCYALAKTLRALHDRPKPPIGDDNRLADYLNTAKANAKAGSFWAKALLPRFGISCREEAYALIAEQQDLLQADTLIHGDYCLPNVLFDDQLNVTALIDLGLAGLSDRHIDLYWAIWSLNYNLGTDQYSDTFLDHYGRDLVNDDKLTLIAAIEAFG